MTLDDLSTEQRERIETFLPEWMADHRIPGAAIAVVDGDSVAAEGFGARTLENNTPVTEDTLFGIGSCTKPFTATAIMQLVENGDLALADHVDDYISHLEDAPGDPVTVEELLAHTSGMPSDDLAPALMARQLGAGGAVPLSSEADFRRHVQASVDRRVTDREAFFYYNSGYVMLGRIIETVTGRSFETYLQEEILSPLGMDRATFDRAAFGEDEDRMTPYLKQEGESTEAQFPFDPLIYPAGGLVSSVPGVAQFIQTVLKGVGGTEERLLTAESVASMTTPEGTFGQYLDGTEVGYGYGLQTEEFLDDKLIGHGGSIGVSNAWFGYLEEAGLGVVLACTTTPEKRPWVAGKAVLALLQDEEPDTAVPHYRLMNTLEKAAGEYTGHRGVSQASVERKGGALQLQMDADTGGQELLLVPISTEERLLTCTTVDPLGMQRTVRFEFGDEEVDLFVRRARLTKPV